MMQACRYESPLGSILIYADGEGIARMRFERDRHHQEGQEAEISDDSSPILDDARRWLDEYFKGKEPSWTPALHITGSDFEKEVCSILLRIPYGRTRTYGDIANEIARKRGGRMSSQAVGGAVGRNPVCIIVPCHRVMGANGNLTGYGGGLDRKVALLTLEKADMEGFHLPNPRKA